eukprot:2763673-Pleurochrysis_carterae.AAC.1
MEGLVVACRRQRSGWRRAGLHAGRVTIRNVVVAARGRAFHRNRRQKCSRCFANQAPRYCRLQACLQCGRDVSRPAHAAP